MENAPDIKAVVLWEAVVSKGIFGTPADTIGFYTTEDKASEAAKLNTKIGHSLGEFHQVKAVHMNGRYYTHLLNLVEVDLPPKVVHPRTSFLSRLIGGVK